jgi:multidrug transporter EmrE-like cation transporter
VSAGLLWGASDVSIKALSGHLDQGPLGWIHPLALVILVASLIGLAVSARSLQVGEAVPVIALTSATANLCTIAAGPIVFGEPLPHDPLALAVRVAAFGLVVVASALTPPPLRAVDGGAAPGAV